ncbi:hypothetical protein EVAR_12089_1 [Eumeta japonica]|uniref:Chitin-binding type-2 domain-containing protein n=1 Tax=Eumeta variegata TaxID=151549 RepID=A0A4C1U5E6_EUMVA|nr:hypothetical protein EVAR_12089_1 [Eumeta japonica]
MTKLLRSCADSSRWRRQAAEESAKKDDAVEICKDKDAGEWFRIQGGEGDNCRDVIQCTASVTTTARAHTYNERLVEGMSDRDSVLSRLVGGARTPQTSRGMRRPGRADAGAAAGPRRRGRASDCRREIGIQAIRCPAGLFFDIEKQTCDWKDAVRNCNIQNKERKVKPLLYTDEPLCQDGSLACGDGVCVERGLFCNGEKDCADGSDENSCGNCRCL